MTSLLPGSHTVLPCRLIPLPAIIIIREERRRNRKRLTRSNGSPTTSKPREMKGRNYGNNVFRLPAIALSPAYGLHNFQKGKEDINLMRINESFNQPEYGTQG